tara:strand:+ start:488 stop:883 length:396 start_codon:yes stop_codon:yes gene_type:complete
MMSESRIIPAGDVLPPMDDEPRTAKPKHGKGDKRRTRDRFVVLNSFVDCSMANLTRSELAVWLVLYRDERKGTACTSAAYIAKRAGTSPRRTLDAIGKLCKRGLVKRIYRGGLNRGASTYRIFPLASVTDK